MGKIRYRRKDDKIIGNIILDYRNALGVRVRENTGTKDWKLAEQLLKQREIEAFKGEHFGVKLLPKIKFSDFVEEMKELEFKNKKSFNSFYKYALNSLNSFFAEKLLTEIESADVRKFKAERIKEKVSERTVNIELSVLRRLYNLAIRDGKTRSNPVKGVDFF